MNINLEIDFFINKNKKTKEVKSFIKEWIEKKDLDVFLRKIPINFKKTDFTPRIILKVNGNEIFKQRGNRIETESLKQYILKNYGK